jgi:type IV secretion system protein VirB3
LDPLDVWRVGTVDVQSRNSGLTADPLFVAVTRPPMRFGVTYVAILVNAAMTMELFLLTRNLLMLLLALPFHGVCMLLCARDPRVFVLLMMWARTRLPAGFRSIRYWKGVSYSPLALDMPDARGQRRSAVFGQFV